MPACNDPLMRGVVRAPGWVRDIHAYAREEYGACAALWVVAELSSRAPPARRPLTFPRLRCLLVRSRPLGRPTEV